MTITWKSLSLNLQITSTSATARQVAYTASNGVCRIDQLTAKNTNASTAYDLYIYIKSDNTTTGTLQEIDKVNVAADTTVSLSKIIGHNVPKSGTIQFHSDSATDLYVTGSGIERAQ